MSGATCVYCSLWPSHSPSLSLSNIVSSWTFFGCIFRWNILRHSQEASSDRLWLFRSHRTGSGDQPSMEHLSRKFKPFYCVCNACYGLYSMAGSVMLKYPNVYTCGLKHVISLVHASLKQIATFRKLMNGIQFWYFCDTISMSSIIGQHVNDV